MNKVIQTYLRNEDQYCNACESTECSSDNQIVYCDGCDQAVHMECYQIQAGELDKDWYCQPCAAKLQPECCFCPEQYQLLQGIILNESPQWAHCSCLRFHDRISLQQFTSNKYTGEAFSTQKCVFCYKNTGYQVGCNYLNCGAYFHIGCLKVNGMILAQPAMESLGMQFQSMAIDDDKRLYCPTHLEDIMLTDDNEDFKKTFLAVRNLRLKYFYRYNCLRSMSERTWQDQQIASIKQKKKKPTYVEKKYEDQFFDELLADKSFKDIRVSIKDKRIRQNFKDYMKTRLSEKLQSLRDEFHRQNKYLLDANDDTYIQMDIALSKKLFDEIVDINNLEAFDAYLVNYFIYNNLIDNLKKPIFRVKEDHQHVKFWKNFLNEINVSNGERLIVFLNQLRFKKLFVVSRKQVNQQLNNDLLENLGGIEDVEIIE